MPYCQAEPAWFATAMARALVPIREDLALLKDRMDASEAGQVDIRQLAAIVSDSFLPFVGVSLTKCRPGNRTCGEGKTAQLKVVPFQSGNDPTKAPVCIAMLKHSSQHNLPFLSAVRRVQTLSAIHRDTYYAGYYPGLLPPVAERIQDILTAIGVI